MIRVLSKQKSGLKVAHINAQSLNNKFDEFKYIFSTSGVDLICVSETWFHYEIQDGIFSLPGYRLFRADRKSHAGGVAIYVRNGISCIVKKSSFLTSFDDSVANASIEYLFVEVTTSRSKSLIGCVYRPKHDISLTPLLEIINDISLAYNNIIIAGDFNSNLFFDNSLIDSMELLSLLPVNTTIPTHFHKTANSLLDLFFVNDKSKVLIYDQLSSPVFSKHDLIFLTYDLEVTTKNTLIEYRDFKNVDYSQLNTEIENINWDIIYETNDVDQQLHYLNDNINNIFNSCVPLIVKAVHHNQPPWFNSVIKHLIKKRDIAYNNWKRFKTSELHSEFRIARKEVVKRIQHDKKMYYRTKFNTAVNSKAKWKQIREIGLCRKEVVVSNLNIDLNSLNRHFINIDVHIPNNNVYENLCYVPIEFGFCFRCVDQCEVLESFLTIKSHAVGMDNVNPIFLKALLPKLLPYITHIFNTILTKSSYPSTWKQSKIIPLPKTNNEFRPIAILPFLSKVFENIMFKQMSCYLNDNDLLSDRQSGFRKGRSCVSALLDVVEELREKLDEKMISFLILLDHSKAFDTVVHSILLTKLEKIFNFSKAACKLIASYLLNRTQAVSLHKELSNFLVVNRGVPQGSILGPLLFCMYINDLPHVLKYCNIQMYADDVQLYVSTKADDMHNCLTQINDDLNQIECWANSNGLSINPKKSKALMISKKNPRLNLDIELKINSSVIEFVEFSSNLGVMFNSQLTWSKHINVTIGRVYGMLRNLWAVQNSTPFEIRLLLAKTYLCPVLLFGCEIYAGCDSSDFSKLSVAFNSIARYVFNKNRRAHISPLSYSIYNMDLKNLLGFKSLVFLHKIIYTQQPSYLFNRLRFARSNRGNKLIQQRIKTLLSERQFFIYAIRLWNKLPPTIQNINNATKFRKHLISLFS